MNKYKVRIKEFCTIVYEAEVEAENEKEVEDKIHYGDEKFDVFDMVEVKVPREEIEIICQI